MKPRIAVNGTATITFNGNYFNGSFGAVSNTLTVQYRYRVAGGTWGSWTAATATKSGNTYSGTATITGLDYRTKYGFQVRATDKLFTATTEEQTAIALPVFDWGENDFNFNVPVTAPNLGRNAINITNCISDTGKLASGFSGYLYVLKPFNLVFMRLYITGFTEAITASTSAFTACTFADNYKPAGNIALSCYGTKDTNALINSDGALRMRPRDGLATGSELHISGIYPLSSSSDLYI